MRDLCRGLSAMRGRYAGVCRGERRVVRRLQNLR